VTRDYGPPPPLARVRRFARERGAAHVARASLAWLAGYLGGLPGTLREPSRAFTFGGETYTYLHRRYLYTWLNERAVEVPIVKRVVDAHRGERVLEVGNVLSHYYPVDHAVVDKYERGHGVLNVDVVDLRPDPRYDLIVSISTIEHVGVDEQPREPAKAMRAVERLTGLLEPGGKLLMTVPVGYNRELDRAIRERRLPLTRVAALRRTASNRWEEVEPDEAWDAEYDFLLYAAQAIVVCEA
jgi:hypothetical protein